MEDFVDTLPPDTLLVNRPPIEPSVLNDVARTFELLGVRSFHACVMALESMTPCLYRSIDHEGAITNDAVETPLDQAFPGASVLIAQISALDRNNTLTQQLAPDRWRLLWRLDAYQAVIADAKFQERRDAVIDMDIALLRLVCGMGVQPARGTAPAHFSPAPELPIVRTERRSRPREPFQREPFQPASQERRASNAQPLQVELATPAKRSRLPLALLVCAAMLTGWVALVDVPQTRGVIATQQKEVERLRIMAQDTMVSELSAAMVSGDYGQVQSVLSAFGTLGYFQGAIVTNGRQRIVSLAGTTERLRIGDALPDQVSHTAQKFDLKLGSQEHGQLRIVPASSQVSPATSPASMVWTTWTAFAVSVASTLWLATRMRRSRSAG
jgi:hypothetical protein